MSKESIEEKIVEKFFSGLDKKLTDWMANYGLLILRISLGIVFLWFGLLKFFKGLSPAEDLVRNTVYFVDPDCISSDSCCVGITYRYRFDNRKISSSYNSSFISSDAGHSFTTFNSS